MALSSDQKKHLVIGGGIGAVAVLVGSWFFGRHPARARFLPGGEEHERSRRKHREDRDENERGEYGRRKKRRHHREHERD